MDWKSVLDYSVIQYGIVFSIFIFLLYFTLSFYIFLLYLCAFFGGILAASKIWTDDWPKEIQEKLLYYFECKNEQSENFEPQKTILTGKRTISTAASVVEPPWEYLSINSRINEALEELFNVIIENYVNKWYKTEISVDNAFIGEIQHQIRYGCSFALKEFENFDFGEFVLEQLFPLVVIHIDRICSEQRKSDGELIPLSVLEMRVLEKMPDLHIAMISREEEMDYLRIVADFFVERLADDSKISGRADDWENPTPGFQSKNRIWPSQNCRHFLRELVLSTMLIPLLDYLSNPDTLNSIFLAAMEPLISSQTLKKVDISEKAQFLEKLIQTGRSDGPDSLLSLKLSDIVREPKLLQAFNMYLQDIRGPTHYLDCFLQAHDLHNHIHKHFDKKDKIFNEIHSDAWQFYSDFIHQSAPNRIKLKNDEIPENFRKAVTLKDKDLIKKTTEEIYKELYQRLNHDFVVPFCQSETYLEYLCGPPPDAVELIREEEDDFQEKQKHPIESSLTLSQFRNRLLSVFSSQNNEEEKPIPIEETVEDEIETVPEALLDDGRDLNKWLVTIPRIEPQKDLSGRIYYIYIVNVERLDLNYSGDMEEDLASVEAVTWTVSRKYDEFHILEQKLREFHGNNLKIGILPEKKVYNQNRTFMDSQRFQFERFVQALVLQPLLKKSELLYTFLTSEEDILEDIPLISDLNPFRAMKNVPNKLQRERGQNLRPYLLNLLANILAPNTFYSESPVPAKEVNSDQSSLQSFSSDRDLKTKFSSKIALDNLILTKQQIQKIPAKFVPILSWTKDFTELLLFFVIRIGGFVSEFGIAILLMCQDFFHQIINKFAKKKTQETLDLILQEDNILAILQSLQKTIIDGIQESSEEEQKLRAELAMRRLDQILEDSLPNSLNQLFGQKNIRQIANDVIKAAQFPRLNKQLSFVLLDAIIDKIRGNNVFDFSNIPKN